MCHIIWIGQCKTKSSYCWVLIYSIPLYPVIIFFILIYWNKPNIKVEVRQSYWLAWTDNFRYVFRRYGCGSGNMQPVYLCQEYRNPATHRRRGSSRLWKGQQCCHFLCLYMHVHTPGCDRHNRCSCTNALAVLKIKTICYSRDRSENWLDLAKVTFTMPARPVKFTRYCLTRWISNIPGIFEIHWVRQYFYVAVYGIKARNRLKWQ